MPRRPRLHPGTHCFLRGPCQHLVTFCLGEEDGLHTVGDASRKLALIDSQGRVWAQEMLLCVSSKHITLLDPDSKVPRGTWVEGAAALSRPRPEEPDSRDVNSDSSGNFGKGSPPPC